MALPCCPVLPWRTRASGHEGRTVLVPARQQRAQVQAGGEPSARLPRAHAAGAVTIAARASGAGSSIPGRGTPWAALAAQSSGPCGPAPGLRQRWAGVRLGSIAGLLEDKVPVPTDRQSDYSL